MKLLKNKIPLLKKNNPYRIIFSQPHLYLRKVLVSVIGLGVITFILEWVYLNTSLHAVKMPSTVHSLFGFVLALLLVFRTNTAYDRWWEGRKKIAEINSEVAVIVAFVKSKTTSRQLINQLGLFLTGLKYDLLNGNTENDFILSYKHRVESIYAAIDLYGKKLTDSETNFLRLQVKTLIDAAVACERIKNTPIPFAYAAHIKISIFIYLITLPFSIFADLGFYAVPIVMLIYYVIAGVELISNEIENPFMGDPNDLPTESLFDDIIRLLK